MFKVEIETGNAAFADGMAEVEIARILRKLADHLEAGWEFYSDREDGEYLLDENGNTVGFAVLRLESE